MSARSAGRVPVHQPGHWRGRFTRAWKIIDMCQRGPGDGTFKAHRRILVTQPGLVILLTSCCVAESCILMTSQKEELQQHDLRVHSQPNHNRWFLDALAPDAFRRFM